MSLIRDAFVDFPSFESPWWCRGGHLQTLAAHFFQNPKKSLMFRRFIIYTRDGDPLVCYHHPGQSGKMILLFHGLSGSSYSGYMIRLGNQFAALGHDVVLVNHRGAHPVLTQSHGIYHSGRSEDMSDVFEWARKNHPDRFQVAVGFSMSANILLLNRAGVRSAFQPDLAIAINGPIDLKNAAKRLDQGFNKIYGLNFTRELAKMSGFKTWPISIYEFDEQFTAPQAGYQSAEHYYEQCSAKNYLHLIEQPTLVLTAEDDPFIDKNVYEQTTWPKSVAVRIEGTGGHLGYLQKSDEARIFWMDQLLDKVVRSIEL